MRYLFGFLCVCALGVMPLMGCSETSGDGGSGGSAGTGGTGGANTTPVTVNITGWDPVGGSLAPLEDVDFCHVGTDYCVTSDSEGDGDAAAPDR